MTEHTSDELGAVDKCRSGRLWTQTGPISLTFRVEHRGWWRVRPWAVTEDFAGAVIGCGEGLIVSRHRSRRAAVAAAERCWARAIDRDRMYAPEADRG